MNTYMKHIKIRKGTWETNSSSTHALVVKKEIPKELPLFAYFGLGDFGWEQAKYSDKDTKCCYLNTALFYRYVSYMEDKSKYYEYRNKVIEILKSYGIHSEWKDIEQIDAHDYNYYVDHCDGLDEFIEIILDNPELLIDWLFNDESLLVTDNDNSEMEYYEEAFNKYGNKEDYWVYGKGN